MTSASESVRITRGITASSIDLGLGHVDVILERAMLPKDEALYRLHACEVRPGQRWKHATTDGIYTIVTTGLAEATLSPVVVYEGYDGIVWVRALDAFIGDNDEGKPRFMLLEDDVERTHPFQRAS
jgi:hypothetical protein